MANKLSDFWKKGVGAPIANDLVEGGLGIDVDSVNGHQAYSKDNAGNIFRIGVSDIDDIDGLQTALNAKEDILGYPAADGYVLTSTTMGVRSWKDASNIGVVSINGVTGEVVFRTGDLPEGIGNASEPANLWYTDARVNTMVTTNIIDDVGAPAADKLYSSQKIKDIVDSNLQYLGSWDASVNTPTISDATGAAGDWYKVSVAGTQDLGSGAISFSVGDDVIFNVSESKYERIGSSNLVDSVNGKVGVVVLGTDDIAEGTANLWYTDARVDARLPSLIDNNTPSDVKTYSSNKIINYVTGEINIAVSIGNY